MILLSFTLHRPQSLLMALLGKSCWPVQITSTHLQFLIKFTGPESFRAFKGLAPWLRPAADVSVTL